MITWSKHDGENNMITWIEKGRHNTKPFNVGVAVKPTTRSNKVTITFFHDIHAKVTNTDYIKVGFDDYGIYFKRGTKEDGYKYFRQGDSKGSSRYMFLSTPYALESWKGKYRMEFDKVAGCYCIQFDNKVK